MMHNYSENYWGMHMGWWFFVAVVVIVFIGWFGWFRRRK